MFKKRSELFPCFSWLMVSKCNVLNILTKGQLSNRFGMLVSTSLKQPAGMIDFKNISFFPGRIFCWVLKTNFKKQRSPFIEKSVLNFFSTQYSIQFFFHCRLSCSLRELVSNVSSSRFLFSQLVKFIRGFLVVLNYLIN